MWRRIVYIAIMKKYLLAFSFVALATTGLQAQSITPQDASKHIGETVTVCGKIFGGRFFEKNDRTLLNMGAAYPNNSLTILIDGENRKKFTNPPEDFYTNKEVCITGAIRDFKGKPEMEIVEISQIVVNEAGAK